jgi:6-phosphogluconolactonase
VSDVEIRVFDAKEEAQQAAAELLVAAAEAGQHIALSGGGTVGPAFEAATRADWSRASVWWGDERCVPPNDDRSNYKLAKDTLLDRLGTKPKVHRIQGELPPDAAAAAYDAELEGIAIDLAFNGIGPDGHTASLFPQSPQLDATGRRAVHGPAGLEPWVDRVTMTLPYLRQARTVVFLVAGADKADAVRRAFAAPPGADTPSSMVRGAERTIALLDRKAASLLDNG